MNAQKDITIGSHQSLGGRKDVSRVPVRSFSCAHVEVATLGLGCGSAIAWEMARRGLEVSGMDAGYVSAATSNNQKWKHSGWIYHDKPTACRLAAAFAHMHPAEQANVANWGAHFLAHNEETLDAHLLTLAQWGLTSPEVTRKLPGQKVSPKCNCTAGMRTPDCVINFAGLLRDLAVETERLGATLSLRAHIKELVRDGNTLTGVVVKQDGSESFLRCQHCVVALGGWGAELLRAIGVELPVRRWKSNIVTLEGELVPHITAWLDTPFLTVVPFRGQTLIADTRRVLVTSACDVIPVESDVELLLQDAVANLPFLRWSDFRVARVHAAIKTEFAVDLSGNQDLAVFNESDHGVRGLTVALPGKASLMFALARQVADQVEASLAATRGERRQLNWMADGASPSGATSSLPSIARRITSQ